MTRQQLIDAGKIWIVYKSELPDDILFEGPKTKAFKFIKDNFGMKEYKHGQIRAAKVIWEKYS